MGGWERSLRLGPQRGAFCTRSGEHQGRRGAMAWGARGRSAPRRLTHRNVRRLLGTVLLSSRGTWWLRGTLIASAVVSCKRVTPDKGKYVEFILRMLALRTIHQ